jgi:hypothetical protein
VNSWSRQDRPPVEQPAEPTLAWVGEVYDMAMPEARAPQVVKDRKFLLTLAKHPRGSKVEVDGLDVSQYVRGVTVMSHVDSDRPTELHLRLMGDMQVTGEGTLVVYPDPPPRSGLWRLALAGFLMGLPVGILATAGVVALS